MEKKHGSQTILFIHPEHANKQSRHDWISKFNDKEFLAEAKVYC
jgi:hypothetical protein